MFKDYFILAIKNLTHRSLRSWLTLLGILIGVMAVVSLIGLGDGLRLLVNSQFGISATEVITVQAGGLSGMGPPGTAVATPLTKDDSEDIEKISSVEMAVPRLIKSVKVKYNDITSYNLASSMPDKDERHFVEQALDLEILEGRMLKDGDTKKVVLGNNFYVDKSGYGKPITPRTRIQIENDTYEVVGILKKKGSFIFDNVVLVNEKMLEKYKIDKNRVDLIVVKVRDKRLMNKTARDIEKLLRNNRNVKEGEEDFTVETPDAAMSVVNDILSGIQIFIALIASISIVVGSLGIVNTMTTAVMERKKQIGIMKAIGARNKDIFILYLIESGLMGFFGGLIGVILGELISYIGTMLINNFVGAGVTPVIHVELIIITLIGAFLIGCIAGIIPAMSAASQKPVEVLRG